MTNRRGFICGCSALAVAVAAAPAALMAEEPTVLSVDLFVGLVNSRFAVRGQELELVEVSNLKSHISNFSLLFRGKAAERLEQNTYEFKHREVGPFQMFIVPVGRVDANFCYYEAVFNLYG